MLSKANGSEIFNILDFMCGSVKDILAKLGAEIAFDELFYLTLLEKVAIKTGKITVCQQKITNLRNELKEQKAQAQCITDLEIAEKICERRKLLSIYFSNAQELVATSKVLVLLVYIGKIECLLIDDCLNDRQVLLFEKKNVSSSDKFLFDYIINNAPFCAREKHILGVANGSGAIQLLCDRDFVDIAKVGIDWLMAVKSYVEEINFARNKFVPFMKSILNSNIAISKRNRMRNKETNFSDRKYNCFNEMFNYYRGINKLREE